MSSYQVRFQYCQENVDIECQKNEQMKNIISRFGTKTGLPIDDFYFLYNGEKVNMNLILSQIIDINKEILIIVCPKKAGKNEIKKPDCTNSIQCSESSIKISENNNEITLKVKVEKDDINRIIYFLNDNEKSFEQYFYNKNDKSNELNENNTLLIIDGKTKRFKKSFFPTKTGIFLIKIIFKNKLSNCEYMFYECKNIIDIDFSKFNTENVKNMKYMFYFCIGLESLNLSSFNTKNVYNMESMFQKCYSLTTINLSSFNTENVHNMDSMFSECYSLIKLNLSSFNTQKVCDMNSMFEECYSLISLNISSFNTKNVDNMDNMFSACVSLITLNLSSFNTQNVNSMSNMFNGCLSLISLNLSSFNTKNVTNMESMFSQCSSLTSINLNSFDTENVDDMYNMFYKCYSLTILNLSSFKSGDDCTSKMFDGCINLSSCGSSDKNILFEFKNK